MVDAKREGWGGWQLPAPITWSSSLVIGSKRNHLCLVVVGQNVHPVPVLSIDALVESILKVPVQPSPVTSDAGR